MLESVRNAPENAARYLRSLGVNAEQLQQVEVEDLQKRSEFIGQPGHPAPNNSKSI